jgi:MinD superfamily P-loop ATPase
MKSIAVTGGKGGTGKSTFAMLLSLKFSEGSKVILCDCDVECPNDYIVLKKRLSNPRNVTITQPKLK